ncbi:MAG: lamin tail domain-containing protein [Pirellulales bacterium]|nr:lamin tail domain-containing protein [Pirellulales bacterium]
MSVKSRFAWTAICGLVLATSAANVRAAIIISQYYEGTSNNKWIELYNSGGSSVDLAAGNYQLSHWSNANRELWKTDGAPTGTQALTGVVAAGGTYLIGHSSAVLPAYAVADQTSGSNGGLNFNGDDSVAVWVGTTFATASIVDVFGLTANTAADRSFVRNANIVSGTTSDFSASDWTEYSIADVEGAAADVNQRLGYHAAIPEPATVAMALLGLAGAGLRRRR